MIDPAVLWTIGIAIVVLPFALGYALNGRNQSDARGRRVNRRWQGRSLVAGGAAAVVAHDAHGVEVHDPAEQPAGDADTDEHAAGVPAEH